MSLTSAFLPPLPTSATQDVTWQHLYGSSPALALAQLIATRESLNLIVTPDAPQAHRLEQEIKAFVPHLAEHVMVFPDWETLPYDNFSPHQDIISERLAVLAKLPRTRQGALIVSLNTLLHRIAPTHYVSGQALQVKEGDQLDIHQL